jgi:hypothetical protein
MFLQAIAKTTQGDNNSTLNYYSSTKERESITRKKERKLLQTFPQNHGS